MKSFEVVKTSMDVVSIKDLATGEILHNPVGPWAEANDLYIKHTHFTERLCARELKDIPLVLFDVGLGAGFNAVAALQAHLKCAEENDSLRPLRIISFERDLGIFQFAIDNSHAFPFMEPFKPMMEELAAHGFCSEASPKFPQKSVGSVQWELRLGPFEKTILSEALNPEIIFFDPYSPKTNAEMWEFAGIKRLQELAARAAAPCLLATYSISTPVRVTFLLAGFFVGAGPRSGAKEQTTQAATTPDLLEEPLGKRWFERWERSHTPHPLGLPQSSMEHWKTKLQEHPQFKMDPPHAELAKT